MARGQQRNQSEKKFWCNVFQTRHDLVGAICDEDLLEKKLKDKNFEVKVTKHFYGGMVVEKEIVLKFMKKITIGNIIGKDIVDLAIKSGFITKENIILIDGVPHAQFVKL